MGGSLKVLFVFLVAFTSASAQCTLDDLSCCLAHFTSIITASGIGLTEQRLGGVCTYGDEILQCLDLFVDQCIRNETDKDDVEDIVNRTKAFITEICPPTSDFMIQLKAKEECIVNSTSDFQICYNKTSVHVSSETDQGSLKKECCEYKELRNCAVQTVENNCGPSASQLVHEEVVHLNGAVLEWVCSGIFNECPSSAVMLASSAFFVLYSIVILKFLC